MKAFSTALGSSSRFVRIRALQCGLFVLSVRGAGLAHEHQPGARVCRIRALYNITLPWTHVPYHIPRKQASKQASMHMCCVFVLFPCVNQLHTHNYFPYTPVATIYAPTPPNPSPTYSQTFENKSSFPPPNPPADLPPCGLFCVAADDEAAGAALLHPPKSSSPPHAGLFAGAATCACAVDAAGAAGVLEAHASLPPQASMLP